MLELSIDGHTALMSTTPVRHAPIWQFFALSGSINHRPSDLLYHNLVQLKHAESLMRIAALCGDASIAMRV